MRCQKGKNIVAVKSFAFAVRIVIMSRTIRERRGEHALAEQVLRSGTSIGANVREAASAQSKADFIAKLSIALKECDETAYWIDLLHATQCLTESEHKSILCDCREIFALLTAIIKSAKNQPV